MESHDPTHPLAGFVYEHPDIIPPPGGRTIRTSHRNPLDYFKPMKASPAGTGWTLTILASLILVGVTMAVLIFGYLNIRSL